MTPKTGVSAPIRCLRLAVKAKPAGVAPLINADGVAHDLSRVPLRGRPEREGICAAWFGKLAVRRVLHQP